MYHTLGVARLARIQPFLSTAMQTAPLLRSPIGRPTFVSFPDPDTVDNRLSRRNGRADEEVERLIRETIEFHLDSMRKEGETIPLPSSRVDYGEVAA